MHLLERLPHLSAERAHQLVERRQEIAGAVGCFVEGGQLGLRIDRDETHRDDEAGAERSDVAVDDRLRAFALATSRASARST